MTMHKALLLRDDIDYMHQEKKEEEDLPEYKITLMHRYIRIYKNVQRKTFTATKNITDNMRINRRKITRKQKWEEKQLYGHFRRQTNKFSHEKTWTWLRKRNLLRETESLLITTQNNAARTNYIKARRDKTSQRSKSRLYGDRQNDQPH